MKRKPDFIFMACISASVSYRESLTKDELVHALRSGELPGNRHAHLRALLEEAPEVLLQGLLEQLAESIDRERLEKNLLKIAEELDPSHQLRGRVERVCLRGREQS